MACCLAVLILFLIVIFAGHSSSEKEMDVNEVLKATSLYFIAPLIAWVTWKKQDWADTSQNTRPTYDTGVVANAGQQDQNSLSVSASSSLSGSIQQHPDEINLLERKTDLTVLLN